MLKIVETKNIKKFTELFSELERYTEIEQKKIIEDMNEIVDGMNKEEFNSVYTEELFNKIYKMIEEKKMSMENAILLLKHAGYCIKMKKIFIQSFEKSSLSRRFEKMIFEEEKKKEGKNEKLLIDFCECYILLSNRVKSELILICVPCLLKAASVKDESEETQKEVEMALLALSCADHFYDLRQELYLKEIKEIIEYHQEHSNLTRFAYQSAWKFFMNRFFRDRNLEDAVSNELHFRREAAKALEELKECVDWKKKEEEMSKEEAKEEFALMRWTKTCAIYFHCCTLWNEEFVKFVNSIVQLFRAAKDNHSDISNQCIYSFKRAAGNFYVKIEDLLRSGVISAVLEEIQQPTIVDKIAFESLQFFSNVSYRLKEEERDEMEEAKRKATKMKMLEKLEEEGLEDIVISIHDIFNNRNRQIYTQLIMIVLHLILKA